jgi:hypothetical protein
MTKNEQDASETENPISTEANRNEDNSSLNISSENLLKVEKKTNSKEKLSPPTNLVDFALSVFKGNKISQDWQIAFDKFVVRESNEDRERILLAAKEKDPDFKITLSLALAVLDGSSNAKSHNIMFSYIESIVSSMERKDLNPNETLFKSWLYASDGVSNIASVFYDRIKRLKESNNKPISKIKSKNIFLIASIWLYRNNEVGFSDLIAFFSKEIYDNKGQSIGLLEPAAFAYAVATANSTKKSSFGKLLFMLVEAERLARTELRQKNLAYYSLEERYDLSKTNNKKMLEQNEKLRKLIKEKENQLYIVTSKLEQVKESARHERIHGNDDKEDLRIKIIRSLEGDLKNVIEKAITANSRIEPNPKTDIVAYQLTEAIEIIHRELSWLES